MMQCGKAISRPLSNIDNEDTSLLRPLTCDNPSDKMGLEKEKNDWMLVKFYHCHLIMKWSWRVQRHIGELQMQNLRRAATFDWWWRSILSSNKRTRKKLTSLSCIPKINSIRYWLCGVSCDCWWLFVFYSEVLGRNSTQQGCEQQNTTQLTSHLQFPRGSKRDLDHDLGWPKLGKSM